MEVTTSFEALRCQRAVVTLPRLCRVAQHSRGGSLLPSQSVSSWLLRMIDN